MYIYIHIYIYTYIYIYVCIYVCMYMYIICTYIHIYYIPTYIYILYVLYTRIHVHLYSFKLLPKSCCVPADFLCSEASSSLRRPGIERKGSWQLGLNLFLQWYYMCSFENLVLTRPMCLLENITTHKEISWWQFIINHPFSPWNSRPCLASTTKVSTLQESYTMAIPAGDGDTQA